MDGNGIMRAFFLLLAVAAARLAGAQNTWPPAPPLKSVPQEIGLLPPSVSALDEKGVWNVTFRYKPAAAVQSVALAGSFNGWNPGSTMLSGPSDDGTYAGSILLGTGDYQYKFVIDGNKWMHDPLNPTSVPDGHSGSNSVLKLGKLAALTVSPAAVGDGQIDAAGVLHAADLPRYFQPLTADSALVRFRTFAHDVTQVSVAIRGGATTAMSRESEDPLFAYWEALVKLPAGESPADGWEYAFVLTDKDKSVSDAKTYKTRFTAADVFHTPDWAKHAIWYQIFPERFRNGDPSNDPQPVRSWTSDWFTPSDFESRSGQSFYKFFVYDRMYGGDIQGLESKLGYLKELGVNAIYLNPIFQATTNHKYNATNYIHVDEHFGVKGDYESIAQSEDLNDPKTWKWTASDKLFLAFLKKAKGLGFRVIIDGVFNHVGVNHPAFVDVKKNGKQSRYADWFEITSWEPFDYAGWFGVKDLPAFRKKSDGLESQQVVDHIYNVTRRWMDPDGDGDPRDGIDGWRLDVPNEIPAPFWVGWRKLVKSINPDAYIVGEIWDRADAWLDGRHFDAVMNYQFSRPVVEWAINRQKKIKVSELDRRLAELRLAYPAPATYVMQNLMDSHDTDRLVSMAHNPDRAYDQQNRAQDNGPNYDNAKPAPAAYARARLIALIQMTYVGAPMVYYGDEAGMWGADDPTCRKPMLWEDLQPYERPHENFVMKDHLDFYKRAIALRNGHTALRTGYFHTLLVDDAADVWAFERGDTSERLIVAINASDAAREISIPLPVGAPTVWTRIWGGAGEARASDGKIRLKVEPVSGLVIRSAD